MTEMKEGKRAWVTLLTVPGYLPGTLVLDYSLKAVGSKYPLVVMAAEDLPDDAKEALAFRNVETIEIPRLMAKIQNPSIKEERFRETWTKLRCFELDEFDRVVLLDSDMLVRKNMDELMEMHLEEGCIAAAHVCACNPRKLGHYPADWIPENCAHTNPTHPPPITSDSPRAYTLLNSGTVVLNPSKTTFQNLERFLNESPLISTFQFPDQDLISEVFKGKWTPLPYYYNALKTLRVIHKPLWNDDDVKCLHYILWDKPWTYRPMREGPRQSDYHDVDLWWWDAYGGLTSELSNNQSPTAKRVREYVEQHVASQ